MIDILVPVLNRPQNAQPLVDSIRASTKIPCRVVFLVSPDDTEQIIACRATGRGSFVIRVEGDDNQYARKINRGVMLTTADFVFLGADDLRFHPGWDMAALKRFEETGCAVIGTNDLGNATVMAGKHATHSLVAIDYAAVGTIDEPGKLLHEGYNHNWVDSEFIATAIYRSEFAFAPDSYVEHLHPFWRKGPDDPVYVRGRETYHVDRRLFQKRRRLWR